MHRLKLLISIALMFVTVVSKAQGMSVNTTGAAANKSAMMDISSTSKGILIPRMTSTQRTTGISSPAQGLMVYQTDAPQGFYYYDGSVWNYIGTGSGTVTSVSSGNLSPIFTSTVTSSSTTPGISYSLSNATAHSFLGNNTGSSAAPTYTTVGPQDLANTGGTASSSTFYRGDGQWISNVTTQGNTFNGANQLVQTNSSSLVSTSNLGIGTADSTKFLRGNNTWGAPIAIHTIRSVTSTTTLNSSDQVVFDAASSNITLTLFSPSLVPKGYQLNLINGSGHICFVNIPSGVTFASNAGIVSGPITGFFSVTYYWTLISDGSSTWYVLTAN